MYETEKLWHPLLLKTFPDGSYLHSSDADISRGREEECRRRLAGEAMGGGKNCLFLRWLRLHHASTLPPIEKPLIAAIVQRGPSLTCGWGKMFLLFCVLFSFCHNDLSIHVQNIFCHLFMFAFPSPTSGAAEHLQAGALPALSASEPKRTLIGSVGSVSLYLLWARATRRCGAPVIHLIWNLFWQGQRRQAPGYRSSSRQIGRCNAGQADGSFSCWEPGWSEALASGLHKWRPDSMERKACR